MSKSTYSTNKNYNRYSSRYSNQSYYVSPLEKLDRLTNKYQSKKVLENKKYEELVQEGKCDIFQISTSNYRYYHIHRETSIDVLNNLIEYAMNTTHYTLDTECQLQDPPKPSTAALIQIEFVYKNHPSILILIETMHLPVEQSRTFDKIKTLCRTIFSDNHIIYSWGDIKDELSKFYQYNLFDRNDIHQINDKNIQQKFKEWFHENHPSSSHVQRKAQETYSLQMAIYLAFNQWLDKRMTLANWGCGLDPALYTIAISQEYIKKKNQIIENEEEYRRLMIIYALNDCLAVTKLISNIYDDKQLINYEQDQVPGDSFLSDEINHDVEIHVQREISELNDDHIHIEPIHNALIRVHVENEPYEMISDDKFDGISLPEIMKLHLPHQQQLYNGKPLDYNDTLIGVHAQNEPSNEIGIISDDDIEQNRPAYQHSHQHQPLTRNQRKNRKKT
ncbi:unnamed protein product [Rotaria socialis]